MDLYPLDNEIILLLENTKKPIVKNEKQRSPSSDKRIE